MEVVYGHENESAGLKHGEGARVKLMRCGEGDPGKGDTTA